MRTTIDLPDDLHQRAMSIARDTSRTLSETVADLLRPAFDEGKASEISRSSPSPAAADGEAGSVEVFGYGPDG